MPDLVSTAGKPTESEMLMSLLQTGVEAYNRDLTIRAQEAGNHRYELETERMQVEGELKIEGEKVNFNRHTVDKYYDNDWKKFKVKAGITTLAGLFFMGIVTVLLLYASDFNQRFDLLRSVVTVLLALLSGKSLSDLFKRDKPPSEE